MFKLLLKFFYFQFVRGIVVRDFPNQIIDVHTQHAVAQAAALATAIGEASQNLRELPSRLFELSAVVC